MYVTLPFAKNGVCTITSSSRIYQLITILTGKDRCSLTSSKDHPEFAKLREQLGREGFIRITRSSWNGDMVTKPFTLNGKKFKKNTRFPCGAAMKLHMIYMK